MKKNLSTLLVLVAMLMAGCGEDDKKAPEIELTAVACSAPEGIVFTFESPDPHCGISREGRIYATQVSGELTIMSPNSNTLELKETTSGRDNFYQSEEGCWSVTIVDGNTLEFKFESLPEPDANASRTSVTYPYFYQEYYLPVKGTVDGQPLVTTIIITRFYH